MIKIYPISIILLCGLFFACSTVDTVRTPSTPGGLADRAPYPDTRRTPVKQDTVSTTTVKPAVQKNSAMIEFGKCAFIAGKYAGRVTANGERYNPNEMTASHPTLPFGTICQVTNLRNGKAVRVRINDRFPAESGRIILISFRAAEALDMLEAGVVDAQVEVLEIPQGVAKKPLR
jgi:rare lipoprotein A